MLKIKYQTKFLIMHTCIIFFVVLISFSCFYIMLIKEIRKNDEYEFHKIADKTAAQIDTIFYDMDKTALQVAANPDVSNLFSKIPELRGDNFFKNNYRENIDITKLLESYNFKNNSHVRICLYNKFDDFVYTSNLAIYESGIQNFFNSNEYKYILDFFVDRSNFVYYGLQENDYLSDRKGNGEGYFFLVREIKDYFSQSKPCGYIEVQEKKSKVSKILDNIGSGICAEILYNDNVILKDNNISKNGNEYVYNIKLKNAPYIINFYKEPIAYYAYITKLFYIGVAVFLVIIFVSFFLESILINYFKKPLFSLIKSIRKLKDHSMRVGISNDNSIDIIDDLEKSFNDMLEKLEHSMDQNILMKTEEIKSYYYALESQMNPHFLHNMLSIISLEANIINNDTILNTCEKLCSILKYNSEMKEGYSTVSSEIHIADTYMSLMKMRYEDQFSYIINMDEAIAGVRVPKFILQPLIENTFSHAFFAKEDIWKIDIRAYMKDDYWIFDICDNGTGFDKEKLKVFEDKKRELSKDIENNNYSNKLSIGGLGIINIYLRMNIEYKDNFIFDINSDENGTKISIGGIVCDKDHNCRR